MDIVSEATLMHSVVSDESADLELFEMANLGTQDTGLQAGYIYVSTAQASHAARVKFFIRPGSGPSFSVSISAQPVLVAPREEQVDRSIAPYLRSVIEWVALNHEKLLQFWNSGTTWDRQQTNRFFDSLQKLTQSRPEA